SSGRTQKVLKDISQALFMAQPDSHSYEFGRFRLKTAERILLREGELVPLTPKVFDILITLVENRGQVVAKDDLMKRVWPSTYVEEGNLTQNISLLRKALGESPGGVQFIETVPRRGYRFVGDINELLDSASSNGPSEAAAPAPEQVERVSHQDNSSSSPVVSIPAAVNQSPWFRRSPAFAAVAGAVVIAIVGLVYFTSWGKAEGGDAIQSIAVLPFVDESSDPDAQYINDKIAESLINSLSKLPQLRVVPRSVVAGYKGREIDPRKVGQELNVRAVVTGRMRRHGDIISIQADLIDLENVAQLWGQHYDHKLSDVLLVQDDISRDIFENLRLKLNVDEKKQLEAYGLYLKGRNAWNKRTGDALLQAIDYFSQAIKIDSNNSAAYAGLADCYNMLVVYGRLEPKEGFPKAKEAALKALEIDESSAEAHTSLAFINFRWDWDRAATEREFQSAIKLKPAYAPAHQWYSSYLVAVERFDEAIAEAKRTEELEPLSFVASSHLGWIYYLSGKNDEAIAQCKKILELDPNSFPARRYLGLAYEAKGMYAEAIAEFQTGVKLSGSPLMLALLGHAYAASGKRTEAQQVLTDLQQLQDQRYVSPYTVAAIYAGLGDKEQAFKWLETAVEARDIWLMNLKVDPVFAKLRSERKFTDTLARIRLRP
ncbi:MAG TPA: winged helix-turn-helix domain-containing protein, partial [Pyrinomonadaceae bacterium]|nr:winged helix-turn-helix domain-containing protein [Pyrinomonadaceae bacterium]